MLIDFFLCRNRISAKVTFVELYVKSCQVSKPMFSQLLLPRSIHARSSKRNTCSTLVSTFSLVTRGSDDRTDPAIPVYYQSQRLLVAGWSPDRGHVSQVCLRVSGSPFIVRLEKSICKVNLHLIWKASLIQLRLGARHAYFAIHDSALSLTSW